MNNLFNDNSFRFDTVVPRHPYIPQIDLRLQSLPKQQTEYKAFTSFVSPAVANHSPNALQVYSKQSKQVKQYEEPKKQKPFAHVNSLQSKPLVNEVTYKYIPYIEEKEEIPIPQSKFSEPVVLPSLPQPPSYNPSETGNGSVIPYNPLPTNYDDRTTKSVNYPVDIKKHYINIDTRFRPDVSLTSSTNFKWRLPTPLKNIISLKVASVEFMNSFYTFSQAQQNITFYVKLDTVVNYTEITIPQGNYDSNALETELNDLLQAYDANFIVTFNFVTGKCKIENTTSNFSIQFPKKPNSSIYNWGIGYNLGFTQQNYTGGSSYTSENMVNILGENYVFLQVGDYNGIQHSQEMRGVLTATSKIVLNAEKFVNVYEGGSNFMSTEVKFPSPINISFFDVKLVTAYNEIIDLVGQNYSFTLEIVEIVNSKFYTNYSNHLLTTE
jgi:hypothetical protein